MNTFFIKNKTLIFLVFITFISSILHYIHNIIHFDHYPEPDWLNPTLIDYFWFFMTPFAGLGLYLVHLKKIKASVMVLTLYALMNMLTLLHYACEIKVPISFTIHLLIWIEAICALALLIYLFVFMKNSPQDNPHHKS